LQEISFLQLILGHSLCYIYCFVVDLLGILRFETFMKVAFCFLGNLKELEHVEVVVDSVLVLVSF